MQALAIQADAISWDWGVSRPMSQWRVGDDGRAGGSDKRCGRPPDLLRGDDQKAARGQVVARQLEHLAALSGIEEGETGGRDVDGLELLGEAEAPHVRQPQLDTCGDVGACRGGRDEPLGHIGEVVRIGVGGENMVTGGCDQEGHAGPAAGELENAMLGQTRRTDLGEDVEHALDLEVVTRGNGMGTCRA